LDWVHAFAHICGKLNGCPVLLVIFSNASIESDIYQNILDHTKSRVYVCDSHTYEVLYANKSALEESGNRVGDFYLKKCYKLIRNNSSPCDDCFLNTIRHGELLQKKRINGDTKKWEQLSGEYINWCGHDAFVQYIDDISQSEEEKIRLKELSEAEEKLVYLARVLNNNKTLEERFAMIAREVGVYFKAFSSWLFVDSSFSEGKNILSVWKQEDGDVKESTYQEMYMLSQPCFAKHESLIVSDASSLDKEYSRLKELMQERKVTSFIFVPLFINDKIVGYGGVENVSSDNLIRLNDLLTTLSFSVSDALIREKAERQILGTQARFNLAVDSAGLGVWEYHIKEHTIVNTSHTFSKRGLLDVDSDIPNSLVPQIRDDNKEAFIQFYQRLNKAQEDNISENFWIKDPSDGTYHCQKITYSIVENERGEKDLAYGVAVDITSQKKEEENYSNTMQTLLMANPEALCTFQFNLSTNTCYEGRGVSTFVIKKLQAKTYDGFLNNVLSLVTSEADRKKMAEEFDRKNLLLAFKENKTNHSVDYLRKGENGESFWVRSFVNLLKNPLNGDIEGVIYSLDINKEVQQKNILHIITEQEYDLISVLHLDTNVFEAVHISSSLPKEYRRLFSKPGDKMDFDEFCSYASSHWVEAEDRSKYLHNSKERILLEELKAKGYYETTVKERFADYPGQIMYRKFRHYYLDESKTSVIIIESDVTDNIKKQMKEVERVKTEAERMRDIMDSISSGIAVLHMPDKDHLSFEYVNKQLYRILGFAPEEGHAYSLDPSSNPLVRQYFENSFVGIHPDDMDRVKKTFADNFNSNHFEVDNYRTLAADGTYIWLSTVVDLREVTA
jgi:PAS domain-containing protein